MAVTFELTNEILKPVLEKSLKASNFEVTKFAIAALKPGAGNPTSLGVYRVTAEISMGGNFREISVVVKHLADGAPIMDASAETSWNYWRREIAFFESPLAQMIPENIGYPEYLGHSKLSDGTELFWNSDLGDLEKNVWKWSDCLYAAELVAELNSIDISLANSLPWLNRSQLEGWLEMGEEFFAPLYPKVLGLVQKSVELSESFNKYGVYLNQHSFIIEKLHSLRQCFVHGDFNLNNLVVVKEEKEKLTALDWQLCGIAAVGTEVAAIFNTARELNVIQPEREKFEEICSVYTKRFNKLNTENLISLNEVRLAAALMGYYILNGVGFYFNQPDLNMSEEENNAKLLAMLKDFEVGPLALYAEVLHELL
jgi:thiamine kinase-like enzyme